MSAGSNPPQREVVRAALPEVLLLVLMGSSSGSILELVHLVQSEMSRSLFTCGRACRVRSRALSSYLPPPRCADVVTARFVLPDLPPTFLQARGEVLQPSVLKCACAAPPFAMLFVRTLLETRTLVPLTCVLRISVPGRPSREPGAHRPNLAQCAGAHEALS